MMQNNTNIMNVAVSQYSAGNESQRRFMGEADHVAAQSLANGNFPRKQGRMFQLKLGQTVS